MNELAAIFSQYKTVDGRLSSATYASEPPKSPQPLHGKMPSMFTAIKQGKPKSRTRGTAQQRMLLKTAAQGENPRTLYSHPHTKPETAKLGLGLMANPVEIARSARAKYGFVDQNFLRALTKSKLTQEKQAVMGKSDISPMSFNKSLISFHELQQATCSRTARANGLGHYNTACMGMGTGELSFGSFKETPKESSQETVRFPASLVTNRKEVFALAEWVVEELGKVPTAAGESNGNSGEEERHFDQTSAIYNKAIKTFADLIGEGCKEQGMILTGIWTEYQKSITNHVSTLRKRTKDKEAELSQLGCNLLGKVETKIKECEGESKKLRTENSRFVQENQKFREVIKDFEHDMEILLSKCAQLKAENRNLKKSLTDLTRNHTSLKAILIHSTDTKSNKGDEERGAEIRDEILKLMLHAKAERTTGDPKAKQHDGGLDEGEEELHLRTLKYKKRRGTLVAGSIEKSVAQIAKLTLFPRHSLSGKTLPVVPLTFTHRAEAKVEADSAKKQDQRGGQQQRK